MIGAGIATQRRAGYKRGGIRCVLAWVLLSFLLSGCQETKPALHPAQYPEIDLREGVRQLLPGAGVWDTPVLSADGRRMTVQALVYEDPGLPYEVYSIGVAERDEDGQWGGYRILREGIHAQWAGRTVFPIQPAFDETGDRIYFTHIEFDGLFSIPAAGSLRSWVAVMPWEGGDAQKVVTHDAWGLRRTELIQHARVSPDGRWLTFYTRVHEQDQGIYLLDLETDRHYKLSQHHDKHPTWDPSGRRIYFHYQTGGKRHRFDFFASGTEQAVLGYIELDFRGGELESWRRVLFDELSETFTYHKHPAEVPGTNLLFFHGRVEPGSRMKLMVRRNVPGSQVYILEPRLDGKKLKKSKHPCSSFLTRDLMFIAKPKGSSDYELLLELSDEAMARIEDVVLGSSPGVPAS